VWSKRYLGRWAFMATGPIEQVRRSGYIHIKHRNVKGSIIRLCTALTVTLCKEFYKRKSKSTKTIFEKLKTKFCVANMCGIERFSRIRFKKEN